MLNICSWITFIGDILFCAVVNCNFKLLIIIFKKIIIIMTYVCVCVRHPLCSVSHHSGCVWGCSTSFLEWAVWTHIAGRHSTAWRSSRPIVSHPVATHWTHHTHLALQSTSHTHCSDSHHCPHALTSLGMALRQKEKESERERQLNDNYNYPETNILYQKCCVWMNV